MNTRRLVLIGLSLSLIFSSVANANMFYGHFQENYFEKIDISGDEQLKEFVIANNFSGNGTPPNPYILSFKAYNFILKNVDSYVILLNCYFYMGYINITNVKNLKIENSTLYEEIKFKDVHNVIFSNVSIGSSYLFFQNSSNVRIENSKSNINLYFKNMKNLYLENVHFNDAGIIGILMENTRDVFINSTSTSWLDIDDSEKIHIAKANITGRSHSDIINSREIMVENSTISEPYFMDVSNLTITNLNVLWDLEIRGFKKISEDIKIRNATAKVLWMKNVKSVEVQNMGFKYESEWPLNTAISMNDGNDITLRDISISGVYEEGIYINRSTDINVENAKISIHCTKDVHGQYTYTMGYRQVAVGMILRNSSNVVVNNSIFSNYQNIGIEIINGEYITIQNNFFHYEISTPIKINGTTRFFILQGNSRGVKDHPIGLEVFIVLIILLLAIILGKYYKHEEMYYYKKERMTAEEYSQRKIEIDAELMREKF